MANRRMFSKNVVRTDSFVDMPQTAQNLYFHLGIEADDDGFVSPKIIMRMLGSTQDDFSVLVAKGFLIRFENGVIVIRHWRVNNELKTDRYKASICHERKYLLIDEKNIYQQVDEYDPDGTQEEADKLKRLPDIPVKSNVSKMETKCFQNVSIGKDSIGKDSIGKDSIGKDSNIILHTAADAAGGDEVNDVIKLFGSLNPSYELLFKRKNQREAALYLLKKYKKEGIDRLIQGAILANQDKFSGVMITTPCQMVDKMAALLVWGNKQNLNSNKKGDFDD